MNIILIFRLFSLIAFISNELRVASSDGEITVNELIEILRKAVVRFGLSDEKMKVDDIVEFFKNVRF